MGTRWISSTCAVLAMTAGSSFAMAQNRLSAPLPASAPTIGSEIKRGADAANRCGSLHQMPTDADGFTSCIDLRQSSNRQANATSYEAFDAGLYFMAKMNLVVAIDVLGKSDRSVPVLQARFNLYDAWYRQIRDKLKLTDDDVKRGALIGN